MHNLDIAVALLALTIAPFLGDALRWILRRVDALFFPTKED
jgi:hypothetical protein